MAFTDEIESIVVDYLHNSRPSSISERIEAAIRHYIDQLDDEAQGRILPGWQKRNRKGKHHPKPPVEELDHIQHAALTFLNRKQRERAQLDVNLKSTVSREAVLGAVAALRDGLSWNAENKIEDLWAENESVIVSERFKRSSPTERLNMLHENSISSAYASEYKRRITALLIQHQRKQDRRGISKGETGNPLRLIGMSRANAKDVAPTASAWLRWIEAWGLGGLVIPGPGHKRAFEHELSSVHFQDLWEFCKQRVPEIVVRVRHMHQIVRNILIKAIQIYEGDEEALRSGQGRLANAYRTRWENDHSDSFAPLPSSANLGMNGSPSTSIGSGITPLETLAEVARSHLPSNHSPGGYTRRIDSVSLSDVAGGRHVDSANGAVQTPASLQDNTTNAPGVRDDGIVADQMRAPAACDALPVPTATHQQMCTQVLQPQLQAYSEQYWPQETTIHNVSLNGVRGIPPSGLAHASMVAGGCTEGTEKAASSLTVSDVTPGNDPAIWTGDVGGTWASTYYGMWPDDMQTYMADV